MGTRSRIAIENPETGKVRSVYCHWDGYPKGAGKTLLDHYTTADQVEALIALGSISVLGKTIGQEQLFHERNKAEDWTLAYHRDRGDDLEIADHDDDQAYYAYAEESWAEYIYLFRQGVWFVAEVGGEAGPMLVNAKDIPELRWQNLQGVLQFKPDHQGQYAIVTSA